MSRLFTILGLLAFAAGGVVDAAAQEAGATLTLGGCLAQDDDEEETEWILRSATGASISADEVELVPVEGVSLGAHVGHTVEVTGVVIPDEDEREGPEAEEEEEDDRDLHLRVSDLRHVSASCEEAR